MKVMIVGHGYVGSAVASIFTDEEKVIIDPKINNNKIKDFTGQEFNAVFVCVDTPKGDNTKIIKPVLDELNTYIGQKTPVCCKSTATPNFYSWAEDTYQNIKIVHSPEYLSSNNNIEKFQNQTFCIIGGDESACEVIADIFWTRLNKLNAGKIYTTDIKTAALVKYAENFFLGLKVSYFNELYKIHKNLGCESSYEAFAALVGSDPRIGRSHTQVPGWDGKFGWGGHCLDKDNYEFMQFSDSSLIRFINDLNDEHRS